MRARFLPYALPILLLAPAASACSAEVGQAPDDAKYGTAPLDQPDPDRSRPKCGEPFSVSGYDGVTNDDEMYRVLTLPQFVCEMGPCAHWVEVTSLDPEYEGGTFRITAQAQSDHPSGGGDYLGGIDVTSAPAWMPIAYRGRGPRLRVRSRDGGRGSSLDLTVHCVN